MNLNPFGVTGFFFFGSLVASSAYLAINKFAKKAFEKYWKIIIVLILINILTKVPYKSNFFDGLEYEDSYIYKASARALYEGHYKISAINPYYPASCIYGSLKDCQMSAIFVTNFLGYPYLIYLGYSLFGYHINISNIISLLFSGISISFLFIVALLILNRFLYAFICCFIYLTIPIFNVYASTSLTEPLSNAYLILVMLLYLLFLNSASEKMRLLPGDILGLAAITFSTVFSILIKTANIALVFCLPTAGLIFLASENKIKHKVWKNKFLISLLPFFLTFLFSYLVLNFQIAIEINRKDIGVNPFSFSHFKVLAPVFGLSFFNFRWYLVYTLFFLAGIIFGLKNKSGLFPTVVFLCYFALYTFHYRSYYFTRGLPVAKDETLRYMTSIVSVYSLIVGLGIYYLFSFLGRAKIIKSPGKIKKIVIAFLIIITSGTSILFTLKCREYFVEDEQNVRISPVLRTLEYLNQKDDILITSEHILFQIYGNNDLKLVDLCSINILIPEEEIDKLINSSTVYYLDTIARDSLDEERYLLQLQYLDKKRKELIYCCQSYKIYRLLPE